VTGRAGAIVVLGVALFASTAAEVRAADVCLSAPVEGQKLQRAGKLRQALDRFTQCARRSCPAEVVQDCTQWAEDVQRAIPSVVVAARDPSGKDLTDVQVSVDGQPGVAVTVRAIDLDPGSHHVVFSRSGANDVAIDVLLREGEKNREIVATIGQASTVPPPVASPSSPPAPAVDNTPRRPIPLATWIAGSVAVAGLGVFAAFGTIGVVTRGSDHCATGCPPYEKSTVDTELRVADVGLGVGVVALGVATVFFLTRPTVPSDAAERLVDVTPVWRGAIVTLGTRF
jgi:hypothetical protein